MKSILVIGGGLVGAACALRLQAAGVQVTLRIVFTAPAESGTYQTTWQAADPNGNLFGDTVYMEIIVQ